MPCQDTIYNNSDKCLDIVLGISKYQHKKVTLLPLSLLFLSLYVHSQPSPLQVMGKSSSRTSSTTWPRIYCNETLKEVTEDVQLYHGSLELPLDGFQPSLCHPKIWTHLVSMVKSSEYDLTRLRDKALTPPGGSEPQHSEPILAVVDKYEKDLLYDAILPTRGIPYQYDPSSEQTMLTFCGADGLMLDSRTFWCFYLYLASRMLPSVATSALCTAAYQWTANKLKAAIIYSGEGILKSTGLDKHKLVQVGKVSRNIRGP